MITDDPAVLPDHDAVRIGLDLDRTANRARGYRVFVVVKAHQAGLGDRCRHRVEAIESAGIRHKLRPFCLKNLPDRLPAQLWMRMHLGVGDAFVGEPGIQLIIVVEAQAWGEEALAHEPDPVLDLPFSQPDAGVQATGSTR
jgi:hypothetical protein